MGLRIAVILSIMMTAAFVAFPNQKTALQTSAIPKLPRIAIGAQPMNGVHLVPPRDDVVFNTLQSEGMLPLNATAEQKKVALNDFKLKFAKQSDTYVNPKMQQMADLRERDLSFATGRAPLAIQPVTATVFALAVDFGATETFTIPVDDGNGDCVTQTVTITGPLNGEIPHPGPLDNNTIWYSPELTADATFYKGLVFGYAGIGRARFDLLDPVDGQPGINLAGYTMQDYYDHVAGDGNVAITGTIENWVTVPHSEGLYGADNCSTGGHGGGAGVPVAQMVVDAANVFSETHPTYYTDTSPDAFWPKYDADHDGVVDTFWTIHAGMGQEARGGAQGTFAIWAHSSDLRNYAQWPNGYKIYEGDPNTTDDDIVIGPYTMQPENLDMGVLAEEFGHNFFGLPDMYTTDVENSIGFWNIMSAGAWGGPLGGTAPMGMPLWFRINAWCGTGYCNWQEPMVRRDYTAPQADITIGQLEKTPQDVLKGVRVNLPPEAVSIPNRAGTGKAAYTGTGRDGVDLTLTRTITVPTGVQTPTLTFDAWWEIEDDWDYGYVMINGELQRDMDGIFVDTNPNGNNLGWGLTGASGDAMPLNFDLSAFAGQVVTLTLRYKTDTAVSYQGWWIDNVTVAGTLVDDFEQAEDPDFPGWTNSDPGWYVAPMDRLYTRYYLAELRSDTKYDAMATTAYVTTYSDEDEWNVERVPYNIPAVLLYFRNTKYGGSYALRPNSGDPPSLGPKYQLLVVDMHPNPLRFVDADGVVRTLNNRSASYDSGLTLQDTKPFTITQVYGVTGGPYTFPARDAVASFDDGIGYYPGFYYGDPCPAGYVCYVQRDSSAVIPAQDLYSIRITDFDYNPIYGLYGAGFSPSWLGSGNPNENNTQFGVHVDLLEMNGSDYNTTATLRFYNSKISVDAAGSKEAVTNFGAFNVVYTQTVENTGVEAVDDVELTFFLDPALKFGSIEAAKGQLKPGTDAAGGVVFFVLGHMEPGEKQVITLSTVGNAGGGGGYLETVVVGWDGTKELGPHFVYTNLPYALFQPMAFQVGTPPTK
jgi:immune inhibitor A